MNLQNLMLQEELERTGRKVMMDSISLAHRIHLIDSLRAITPGAPLVVDGDTLLRLYARRGAISPEQRVETVRETIERLGHRLSLGIDTIYVFKGDLSSDIMSGNEIILSITDNDGLWAGTSREKLAADHAILIQAKINELQDEYGLHRKLWGLILALVIIAVQVLLLEALGWHGMSCRSGEILDAARKLASDGSRSAEVRAEALKTINRVKR